MAAAEAVAGVIESNRLSRDNQKLTGRIEDITARLNNLRTCLEATVKIDDYQKSLGEACRNLVERYSALACRVVKIEEGELSDMARYETSPGVSLSTQSYQVAVINAIKRKKMVVLNQEAKGRDGGTYISRTAVLNPFSLQVPGEFALLLEAPGNGLSLDNRFLSEIEAVVNIITLTLNAAELKETDSLHQTAVSALLRIMKIPMDTSHKEIFRSLVNEAALILGAGFSSLVFIRDEQARYQILDTGSEASPDLADSIFLPGEGPVGRAAATGESLEFIGKERIEAAWNGLDQVNQDFLNYVGGEQGLPNYQLNIPVTVLDNVIAVIAVFGHTLAPGPTGKQKALVFLAAQLLSIRMSMAGMDERMSASFVEGLTPEAGHIINRINNDLATIMGQAELMERHPDISGQIRLAAGEILKAAEQAAGAVKRLQDKATSPEMEALPEGQGLTDYLNRFIDNHRVTGNLYMFENNRTVVLQRDLGDSSRYQPRNHDLSPFLEGVLKYFVTLQEEGDEVLLSSLLTGGYFYISLIRGSRDRHESFSPAAHDFGSPDVLPPDIAGDDMIKMLEENEGAVSFDRFGRRPTYLTFRFPCPDELDEAPVEKSPSEFAGLRILAIDDQQMILDLLTGICQSLGLELAAFQDPDKGLEEFRNRPFDIVMVDLAIGQISGWDIAREVKRSAAETPVIMMTGWGINIDPERATSGGVDFTLAKPFRIEQLMEVIGKAKTKLISS
jgi:CheY-like chemotaxis protein